MQDTSSGVVLRRLEAWAHSGTGLDVEREEEPPNEDQSIVAGPLVEVNVISRCDLEVHVLYADNGLRIRQRVAHASQLNHFHGQYKCCVERAWHAMQTLQQLAAAANVCERMKRETAPLLSESESWVLRQREEAAFEDALDQQLKPLRDARAVAHQLDAGFDDAPAYSSDHPIVAALRVLDQCELGLTDLPHWRGSSK